VIVGKVELVAPGQPVGCIQAGLPGSIFKTIVGEMGYVNTWPYKELFIGPDLIFKEEYQFPE
jgi:hypothetical protein